MFSSREISSKKNAKENSFLMFDCHLVVKGLGGAYGKTMFESS